MKPTPKIFVGEFKLESTEDGGQALIAESLTGDDPNMFVRVQSWADEVDDVTPIHPGFQELIGKKVRVTLEVIE